jgi:hypothetical protein
MKPPVSSKPASLPPAPTPAIDRRQDNNKTLISTANFEKAAAVQSVCAAPVASVGEQSLQELQSELGKHFSTASMQAAMQLLSQGGCW